MIESTATPSPVPQKRSPARTFPSRTAPPKTFPIVETFHSLQGEGTWAGTSAFFIRLAGCDVGCPWCDTKESWSAKRHPRHAIHDLVQQAQTVQP
ncbi:MAG: 7-carboxy-7-deazaguanine synthase QueE, partial [Cyanobacteria bacterium P01_A01_bin.105]